MIPHPWSLAIGLWLLSAHYGPAQSVKAMTWNEIAAKLIVSVGGDILAVVLIVHAFGPLW